ncbi:hypothetical protein BE20_14085 [Sorangium cellulosum]|uniref:Uncharacterized protein n=1 Tax=Sorangium cellulosum TaxID=56 RepID=A0A150SH26_SORCE|nr:hypothetical protein BE18_43145 [Sorangium cellulosum]KYF91670.1 hypothetical protein BE20_14085 [Sorangium cellulosum]
MARDRGVSLEEFARVRARLDAGRPKREVLADLGLDASRWNEVEEEWLASLADDVERGEPSSLRVFEAAYRVAWGQLGSSDPGRATALDDALGEEPEGESEATSTALLHASTFAPKEALPFKAAGEAQRPGALEEPAAGAYAPQAGDMADPCATQLLPASAGPLPEEETLPLSGATLLPAAMVPFRRAP